VTKSGDHWQAVELSREVGKKPKRVFFEDKPVVLFRAADGLSALHDRCPHRHVELSKGKVVGNAIECPYHGWSFNGQGKCTAIPCHLGDLPSYRVKALSVCEKHGFIFLSSGEPSGEPYAHCMEGEDVIVRLVTSDTQSTMIDAAENILDATHTHYTHKGLLRGLSDKRYKVKVEVTGGKGVVEANYTGESQQEGLISRLLGGEASKTIGRFRYPGIAELEYWSGDTLSLATTFHLRDGEDGTVEGLGYLIGPKQNGFGYIKALFFKPLFNIALQQDRRVLKSASDNAGRFPPASPVIGPLDFLRRDIELIMDGQLPAAAEKPATHYLEL